MSSGRNVRHSLGGSDRDLRGYMRGPLRGKVQTTRFLVINMKVGRHQSG